MTAALSGADAKEDMVERVAKALHAGSDSPTEWFDYETDREYWRDQARAAIAAMREPTEAMCAAAEATGDHWYFDDSWAAMIDAALKEGK